MAMVVFFKRPRSRQNVFTSRRLLAQKNEQRVNFKPCEYEIQASFLLSVLACWKCKFWTNSIGHLGWLSRISNFPRFHKNVNSLELWKYISENSSPKGSFDTVKENPNFPSCRGILDIYRQWLLRSQLIFHSYFNYVLSFKFYFNVLVCGFCFRFVCINV